MDILGKRKDISITHECGQSISLTHFENLPFEYSCKKCGRKVDEPTD